MKNLTKTIFFNSTSPKIAKLPKAIQVYTLLLLGGAVFFLTGCTEMQLGSHYFKKVSNNPAPYNAPAIQGKRKTGNPYVIMGKTYYPIKSSNGYRQKGIASWYGKDFHGKKTANGERYNMHDMTAAHPTLPLPTYVRVTNLKNGRSVMVRVNDRGPFLRGRLIDMSYRAARELRMVEAGVVPVLVEALPTDGTALRKWAPIPYQSHTPEVRLASAQKTQYLPPINNRRTTEIATNRNNDITPKAGFQHIIRRPEPQNAKSKTATATTVKQRGRFTDRIAMRDKINIPTQSMDFPKIEEETTLADNSQITIGAPKIFIQTGAFGSLDNAERQQGLLKEVYDNSTISKVAIRGRTLHRVRIGPLASVEKADNLLANLVNKGFNVARIVVD